MTRDTYAIHTNVRYAPLEEIEAGALADRCTEGVLLLDIEGKPTAELHPRQGMVVPKGVVHRTRAPERAVVLMVEPSTVVPTGDA